MINMLLRGVALGALLLTPIALPAQDTDAADDAEVQAFIAQFESSLDKKTGDVALPNGVATLHLTDDYYYLAPADAEKVLVQAWGNPPGSGSDGLGMIFPADAGPFDEDNWAATIDYEEDGYVSDEDAGTIDYDDLLSDMKSSVAEESRQRVKQGYPSIELVGWAAKPFYDAEAHKLHWAKEIRFDGAEDTTLNYNIRVLGRKGVLVINFIAGMGQKDLIDRKLGDVLAIADFNDGSRYEDFDPSIDKVAAYGIGALVAGKLAAKAGLLTAALLALKKFGVFLIAGIAALFGKLFKKNKDGNPGA